MSFKVTARTILQLGAELISSDAIAFYELIKNAFDARSKKVTVRVVIRLPQAIIDTYRDKLIAIQSSKKNQQELVDKIKLILVSEIIEESKDAEEVKNELIELDDPGELIAFLSIINYIEFEDQGDGMSLPELEDIYLTIGTRHRKRQRDDGNNSNRPILGEKGLGRLSVMRLGNGLLVETTKTGERHYNVLEVDWNLFSHDSDALIESIPIAPTQGRQKSDRSLQGTTIRITDLRSEWSKSKLEEIAMMQLAKFIDPFEKKNRDFIKLWYNNQPIILQSIDKIVFNYAHAIANATLEFDRHGNPIFHGEVEDRIYNRKNTFSLTGTHLASVLEVSDPKNQLSKLGPFDVKLYWYNRKLLRESEGVPDAKHIQYLVKVWGGGLMLYRNGFRINPYGGPSDDWLDLDQVALSRGGYKMNRSQIIGKVDITSEANPHLVDQTNREGLRDNREKSLLITLLQYFIWDEVTSYTDEVKKQEEENRASLSLADIETRIEKGQKQVKAAIATLREKFPSINKESKILETIEDVLNESQILFKRAKASADILEDRLKTTVTLAGLGLMVDVIAHELNRSTSHALRTIQSLDTANLSAGAKEQMDTLRLQLKTLQTRLKVIDPLGPSGRQTKTITDLRRLIDDTVKAHNAQFKRHNIRCELTENGSGEWKANVVPGMIVQILENLISNSVYWIKQEQNVNRITNASIKIVLDKKNERILFSDNGPGIPRGKREDVFRPFFSTKPPGEGKGLGLYISREIAKYHDASFELLDNENNTLHTFVLNLKPLKK